MGLIEALNVSCGVCGSGGSQRNDIAIFFLVAADSYGGFLYLFVFIVNIHLILVGCNTIGITEPFHFDNEIMPPHNIKITDVNIGCSTNIAYLSKY